MGLGMFHQPTQLSSRVMPSSKVVVSGGLTPVTPIDVLGKKEFLRLLLGKIQMAIKTSQDLKEGA